MSYGNDRVPEPTYVSASEDSFNPMSSGAQVSHTVNESFALTCRFDAIDFDVQTGEVPCFQKGTNDRPVIARLRGVARENLCKSLAALNAESVFSLWFFSVFFLFLILECFFLLGLLYSSDMTFAGRRSAWKRI